MNENDRAICAARGIPTLVAIAGAKRRDSLLVAQVPGVQLFKDRELKDGAGMRSDGVNLDQGDRIRTRTKVKPQPFKRTGCGATLTYLKIARYGK